MEAPPANTIAGNVTQYERSCLQREVSPGVFEPWPSERTKDADWCWYRAATKDGKTLFVTACLNPPVLQKYLLEATKGTSKIAASQQTYYTPSGKGGASIATISGNLPMTIKKRRPETAGRGYPISLIVKPEFEGGETVRLSLTPDWRSPYRAVITATCGVNQETIGKFHGIPRTIYLADGSQSPGYWPLYNSQKPSDRSAWNEALQSVRCLPMFDAQVDRLTEDFVSWVPNLTSGQDAKIGQVTVVTLSGTLTQASLALTITQPEFDQKDQVQLLNTTSGRQWG